MKDPVYSGGHHFERSALEQFLEANEDGEAAGPLRPAAAEDPPSHDLLPRAEPSVPLAMPADPSWQAEPYAQPWDPYAEQDPYAALQPQPQYPQPWDPYAQPQDPYADLQLQDPYAQPDCPIRAEPRSPLGAAPDPYGQPAPAYVQDPYALAPGFPAAGPPGGGLLGDLPALAPESTRAAKKGKKIRIRRHLVTDCPEEFRCAIDGKILTHPMCAPSGHLFEKKTLEQWMNTCGSVCPVSGDMLTLEQCAHDTELQKHIVRWFKENEGT